MNASPVCNHGAMTRRQGEKNGRAWAGWFCSTPKGTADQCSPIFDKQAKQASAPASQGNNPQLARIIELLEEIKDQLTPSKPAQAKSLAHGHLPQDDIKVEDIPF